MIEQQEFDVVIAGAGFAGLYLARILSKKYTVCVVERNADISGPLNTTGSTIIDPQDDIFTLFSIPRNLVVKSYNSAEIFSPKRKVLTPPGSFDWVLLDIPRLKDYFYSNFSDSVIVLFEHEARNLIKGGEKYKGIEVYDKSQKINKSIFGKVIVDATGSSVSLVSKASIKIPKHLSKCFQIDADVGGEIIDDLKINIYLGFDFCPGGYAYIFPISPERVRIGTCGTPDFSKIDFKAEDLLKEFIKYTGLELKNINNKVDISVFTGGVVKNNSYLNLISLGDSAGYISPVIGEGIRFALHSAEIGASLVEECLVKNNPNALKKFHFFWKKRFGSRFFLAYLMQVVFARVRGSLMDLFVAKVSRIIKKDPKYIYRMFATKFTIYDIIKMFI